MIASHLLLVWLSSVPPIANAAILETGAAADTTDTTTAAPRIVRRFPPVEVRAAPFDLLSSQTVHTLSRSVLRTLPVDGFAQALALQAGVVAQGEELHVRGGRSGETAVILEGISLNEPLRNRLFDLPLLALRSAELVSGAPEARVTSGLAGAVELNTIDPDRLASAELRWRTDGGTDTRYDRVSARASAPLHRSGLGFAAAADATFDDTWLPALRSNGRHEKAGLPFGWRAENHLVGFFKLAPVEQPRRFNVQVIAGRHVHEPYDPGWTLDGWVFLPPDPKDAPIFSPAPQPGYLRYRAADHLAITDDRSLATLMSTSAIQQGRRATLSLGWLRTRTVTSVNGQPMGSGVPARPAYANPNTPDRFHVLWGDYPLARESRSDVFTLRGDGEMAHSGGGTIKGGAGITYDDVSLREVDVLPGGWELEPDPASTPLDGVRAYHAWAPGSFAYLQSRWASGGLILNTGLRAEYFTAGPQAGSQTLPGRRHGTVSLSPRLGIAYPISVRDVFSLAYLRIQQAPMRDALYDHREAIGDRQPLGNPALLPATLISYQAAVKHLINAEWSFQTALFFRDLFGQIGARDVLVPHGEINLAYTNDDEGHAMGFELSLVRAVTEHRRIDAHYTWLQAWGDESSPEGDPYGLLRSPRTAATAQTPLSWDRRHSLNVTGVWDWRKRWTLSWSTALGSPLPWTPKPVRETPTDLGAVNSRRLHWIETTNVNLEWAPRAAAGLTLGIEARNVFDHVNERRATLNGYPNPVINTVYDDYGAYRTETGHGGGAYLAVPGTGDQGLNVAGIVVQNVLDVGA